MEISTVDQTDAQQAATCSNVIILLSKLLNLVNEQCMPFFCMNAKDS